MFTVGGRGTYALETEVSFLSSLVLSPSAAQTTAKDLWPGGLSPKTEAEIQSAMADGAPGILSRCLPAAKGKGVATFWQRASATSRAERGASGLGQHGRASTPRNA